MHSLRPCDALFASALKIKIIRDMESRKLQHMLALAAEGSFARAAERSHLSQSAFSRSIQALEK